MSEPTWEDRPFVTTPLESLVVELNNCKVVHYYIKRATVVPIYCL
jgi:hypothetical protein